MLVPQCIRTSKSCWSSGRHMLSAGPFCICHFFSSILFFYFFYYLHIISERKKNRSHDRWKMYGKYTTNHLVGAHENKKKKKISQDLVVWPFYFYILKKQMRNPCETRRLHNMTKPILYTCYIFWDSRATPRYTKKKTSLTIADGCAAVFRTHKYVYISHAQTH